MVDRAAAVNGSWKSAPDIPLEEALALLLDRAARPVAEEAAPLSEADGRVLRRDIRAGLDYPPFDRSPLDGYAVDHRDLAAAGPDAPVTLRVGPTVFAGDAPPDGLPPGRAVRVMTGAPLPAGVDSVVGQEHVQAGTDGEGGWVRFFAPTREHENYRFRGEEIRAGDRLVPAGRRLGPVEIALLASQGLAGVPVYPRPRVAFLATGSELTPPGEAAGPGRLFDSNNFRLAARVKSFGGTPIPGGVAADDPDLLAETVGRLLERSDLVVTTGGVSAGARDFLPRAGRMLGAETLFHSRFLKPGGPTLALAVPAREGRPASLILGLPGTPFGSALTFELLGAPLVRRLAGESRPLAPKVRGRLRDPYPRPSPERTFLQARLEGGDVRLPKPGPPAVTLRALADCNALADIPAGSPPLAVGDEVELILL